jgi:hypothetical protein
VRLEALPPFAERLPGDPEVPARACRIAGVLGGLQEFQPRPVISQVQIRRMVVQQHNPLPRNWTTVDYKS